MGALEGRRDVALGLVTGNIARGAALKLGAVRMDEPFQVGAFGSDSAERNQLPGVAIRRAENHRQTPFPPDEVVVIGDTPRDVECGRHVGARTVAVATGRFPRKDLEQVGADRVLSDLSKTEDALAAILDWDGREGDGC